MSLSYTLMFPGFTVLVKQGFVLVYKYVKNHSFFKSFKRNKIGRKLSAKFKLQINTGRN